MTDKQNFHIDTFLAKIGTDQGPQRNNRHFVKIPVPEGLKGVTTGDLNLSTISTDIQFWCRSTSTPDLSLNLHPIVRYGYGLVENKPHVTQFKDFKMVVINDAQGNNMRFFHEWLKMINNHDFSQGISTGNNQWEIAYKSDYAVDMNLTTYDMTGKPVQNFKLIEAFPYFVGGFGTDWGQTNTYVEFPVAISYFSWVYDQTIT